MWNNSKLSIKDNTCLWSPALVSPPSITDKFVGDVETIYQLWKTYTRLQIYDKSTQSSLIITPSVQSQYCMHFKLFTKTKSSSEKCVIVSRRQRFASGFITVMTARAEWLMTSLSRWERGTLLKRRRPSKNVRNALMCIAFGLRYLRKMQIWNFEYFTEQLNIKWKLNSHRQLFARMTCIRHVV